MQRSVLIKKTKNSWNINNSNVWGFLYKHNDDETFPVTKDDYNNSVWRLCRFSLKWSPFCTITIDKQPLYLTFGGMHRFNKESVK